MVDWGVTPHPLFSSLWMFVQDSRYPGFITHTKEMRFTLLLNSSELDLHVCVWGVCILMDTGCMPAFCQLTTWNDCRGFNLRRMAARDRRWASLKMVCCSSDHDLASFTATVQVQVFYGSQTGSADPQGVKEPMDRFVSDPKLIFSATFYWNHSSCVVQMHAHARGGQTHLGISAIVE